MAIVSKDLNKKQVIDLTGPEGNAYFLLGYGKKLSKVLPNANWDNIQKEMTSGDYENLIKTFDKYFGEFVDLER